MTKKLHRVEICFLGTAKAVPDKHHENTHFFIQVGDRNILVDCVGNPIVRLEQAGIDPLSITDVILTHFHPDHVSGFPLLLMDLWLMGREAPLNVFGLEDVVNRAEKMMGLYDWHDWRNFYPVLFHPLPSNEKAILIDSEGVMVQASSLCHMIPSIGIRVTYQDIAIAYSSDTAPCEALVRLAEGVDLLIHEASGEGSGHSSPEQAAQIAEEAGVKKLVMIHYPPSIDHNEWVGKAQKFFSGEVSIAKDLETISL